METLTSFILIHTSVKLVTRRASSIQSWRLYFNPHEREARDEMRAIPSGRIRILIHTSVKLVTGDGRLIVPVIKILIHTSVKLVTANLTLLPASVRF